MSFNVCVMRYVRRRGLWLVVRGPNMDDDAVRLVWDYRQFRTPFTKRQAHVLAKLLGGEVVVRKEKV